MTKSIYGSIPILFLLSIIAFIIIQFPSVVTSVTFTPHHRQPTLDSKSTTFSIEQFNSDVIRIEVTLFIFHPEDDPFFAGYFTTDSNPIIPSRPSQVQFYVDLIPTPPGAVEVTRNEEDDKFGINSSWVLFASDYVTPPNSIDVAFTLPTNSPYCLKVEWWGENGSNYARHCRPGQRSESDAIQPFPTTIIPQTTPGEYLVRIGGLEGFGGLGFDDFLEKFIGFGFKTHSATVIPIVNTGEDAVGYVFDSSNEGSFSKVPVSFSPLNIPSFSGTGIRFFDFLPLNLRAIEFYINFAEDPAKDINSWLQITPLMLDPYDSESSAVGSLGSVYEYEFGHGQGTKVSDQRNQRISIISGEMEPHPGDSPFFPNLQSKPIEVKWEIKVSKSALQSAPELEISFLYLSVPTIFDNDMAWLGCDVVSVEPDLSTGTISGKFEGPSNRLSEVQIAWNSSTSMTLSCIATYSFFAQEISKVSPAVGQMFDFYASIADNHPGPKRFSSAIPLVDLMLNGIDYQLLPSFDKNPITPQMVVEPYIYGWDSSNYGQYLLTINSNHISPLEPDTLVFHADDLQIVVNKLPSESKFYSWEDQSATLTLPEFESLSSSPDVINSSFSFPPSFSLPPPLAMYISPTQKFSLGMQYYNVPRNPGDDLTLSNLTGTAESTSENPIAKVDFAQGAMTYSTVEASFPPVHLPNFQITWPSDLPLRGLPKTQNSFDLIFTLFRRPYFSSSSDSEYDQLPNSSVWKRYPTTIYPGTIFELQIALSDNSSGSNVPIQLLFPQPLPVRFFADLSASYQLIEQRTDLDIITIRIEYQGSTPHIPTTNLETRLQFTLPGPGPTTIPSLATIKTSVNIFTRLSPTVGQIIPQQMAMLNLGTDKRDVGEISVSNYFTFAFLHTESWVPFGQTSQVFDRYYQAGASTSIQYTPPTLSDPEVESFNVKLELWHYPVLTMTPLTFSTTPKKLQTVKAPEAPFEPGMKVPLGGVLATRGYSRVFYHVTTTINLIASATEVVIEDSMTFFNIAPNCLTPTDVNQAFKLEGFANLCTEPTPICPNSGVCSIDPTTSTGGGTVDPSPSPSPIKEFNPCDECNINNTINCDSNNKTDPCECKTGFTGRYCNEAVECEKESNKKCNRKNGFTELIADGTCDEKCTCYDHWQGQRCTSCGLKCFNSGIPYNDCARCGCIAGFTGETCGCQTTQGKITINAFNDLLVANQPLFTPLKSSQLLSINQEKISYLYQYPFELDEVDNQIVEMGRELYIAFATELMGNKDAKIPFDLSLPSKTTTRFEFSISFGCTDSNNDLKDIDVLKQYWTTFSGKFAGLPTIQKYFGTNVEIETDDLTLSKSTLPPDDERLPENSTIGLSYGLVISSIAILFLTILTF